MKLSERIDIIIQTYLGSDNDERTLFIGGTILTSWKELAKQLEADSELLQGLIEMGRREGYLDISPFEGRECAERAVKEWRESK